jgi:hypothetical protein
LFTSISVANSRQLFLARLREKFSLRRKISVAVAKLCFAVEIPARLATLMFVITADPLIKMARNFDKQTRAP